MVHVLYTYRQGRCSSFARGPVLKEDGLWRYNLMQTLLFRNESLPGPLEIPCALLRYARSDPLPSQPGMETPFWGRLFGVQCLDVLHASEYDFEIS
ncbi:hypothetical protein D9613_000626 [Agrocybe pediades]|uniref:Uncharacterized protein n=1 Tax=Agrocybe pediades TaxID=84607 RepID=A0A8H4QZF0_9AGAR|nr:hypothetical protein D9613_000626 [Agrocybe pediades]